MNTEPEPFTADQKFWITIVLIVATAITTSICGGMYLYNLRCEAAFKAGLCEGQLPGSAGTYWIKP